VVLHARPQGPLGAVGPAAGRGHGPPDNEGARIVTTIERPPDGAGGADLEPCDVADADPALAPVPAPVDADD